MMQKQIDRILQHTLHDTDISIRLYISQILTDSLSKNQINDSNHIVDILQDVLIRYVICSDSSECNKLCVSIFDELIKSKHIATHSVSKQLLFKFISSDPKFVMARYSEDGMWYKAIINEIQKDDTKSENDDEYDIRVNITYNGYGNSEWIDITDIALPNPSYDMIKITESNDKKLESEKEEIEEKHNAKSEKHEKFEEFSVECLRLFGRIFLLYLDDSCSINELLEMNLLNDNLLSIDERDPLRRKICDRDWNQRINRFKKQYYDNKKKYNLCNATTCNLCPFYSLFKIYKIENENLLHSLIDNDDNKYIDLQSVNQMSSRCKILCAILLNVQYSKKTKYLHSPSNAGLSIQHKKLENLKSLIDDNGNISHGLMQKLVKSDDKQEKIKEGDNISGKLVSKMIKITRQYTICSNDKNDKYNNSIFHPLKFCHKLNFKMRTPSYKDIGRMDEIDINGILSTICDLDKIDSKWISLIKNDLRKLCVTKLLNIKQFYVANLQIVVKNYWGLNKFQCTIIFAWCYDNYIFVWYDFLQ